MTKYKGYTRFKTLTVFDDVDGWELLDILDVQIVEKDQVVNTKRCLFGQKRPTSEDEVRSIKARAEKVSVENRNLRDRLSNMAEALGACSDIEQRHELVKRELRASEKMCEAQKQTIANMRTDKNAAERKVKKMDEKLRRLREVLGADAVDKAIGEVSEPDGR